MSRTPENESRKEAEEAASRGSAAEEDDGAPPGELAAPELRRALGVTKGGGRARREPPGRDGASRSTWEALAEASLSRPARPARSEPRARERAERGQPSRRSPRGAARAAELLRARCASAAPAATLERLPGLAVAPTARASRPACAEAKDSLPYRDALLPRGAQAWANAASPSPCSRRCWRRMRRRLGGIFAAPASTRPPARLLGFSERLAAARRRPRAGSFRSGRLRRSRNPARPLPRGARPRGTPRVTARRPARKCTCSRTRTWRRRRTRSRFRRGTSCAACARSRCATRRCPSTRGAARRCARRRPARARRRRGSSARNSRPPRRWRRCWRGSRKRATREIEGRSLADKKVAFARIRGVGARRWAAARGDGRLNGGGLLLGARVRRRTTRPRAPRATSARRSRRRTCATRCWTPPGLDTSARVARLRVWSTSAGRVL